MRRSDAAVHYKMYKKGRMWLIAGMTTLTWQVMSVTGQAATSNSTQTETASSSSTATITPTKAVTLKSTATSSATTSSVANNETTSNSSSSSTSASSTNSSVASSATSQVANSTATSNSATSQSTTTSAATKPGSQQSSVQSERATVSSSSDSEAASTATADTTSSNSDTKLTDSTATPVVVSSEVSSSADSQASVTSGDGQSEALTTTDSSSQVASAVNATITTAVQSNAKSKLARAAVVTTSYDDPTNLSSGFSGSSKWYVTATGELHIEAGTLADIEAASKADDGFTVVIDDSQIPWSGSIDQVTTVIFDGQVKANKQLSGAFAAMPNLQSIQNLNLLDTAQAENMAGLFYQDTSLTSLDLANFNTGHVTNMYGMFGWCSALTSLDVSSFDTSQVTDMGEMFFVCSSLPSLDVSNLDTSQVTNMIAMFAGLMDMNTGTATHHYNLDLSNFNTSKVTNMSQMFTASANLTSINVSSFDTSQVTTMSGMFCGSPSGAPGSLTSLDLSNFDMRNVTVVQDISNGGAMLDFQPNLKSIKLGPNVWLQGIQHENTALITYPPTNETYSGNWISTTTGTTYNDISVLMALYTQSDPDRTADTFVWQEQVMVQDTTIKASPESQWTTSDNLSNRSAQKIDAVTVVVDGVVNGNVDTTIPGTYQVAYQYVFDGVTYTSDAATVTVVSQIGIDINEQPVSIVQGDKWNLESAFESATGTHGETLNYKDLTVTNNVDTSTPGNYSVTYSYTDKYNNTVTKTLTVTVVASQITIDVGNSNLPVQVVQGGKWDPETVFNGATGANGESLNFLDLKVTGAVDTSKAGDYPVTYSYTDAYGNTVSQTITVTVVVNTTASITAKSVTLTQGGTWNAESGFVGAKDADGKDVAFKDVVVTGNIDTSKTGDYPVTYSYTDAYGNTVKQTITVTIVANTTATITAKDVTLTQGAAWNAESGFVGAHDTEGNDVAFKDVVVTGSVNTSKPGRYDVTYRYTDKFGNEVSQTIKVTVVAGRATINVKDITVIAGAKATWKAADNFVNGTDANGKSISFSDVKVTGADDVDLSKSGSYKLTYSYTDEYGNQVSQTVTLTVKATQISLNTKDVIFTQGDTWANDNGFVSGTDETGQLISFDNVTVTGTVNTTKPGMYALTYRYTDAVGNQIVKTVIVTVKAKDVDTGAGNQGDQGNPDSNHNDSSSNQDNNSNSGNGSSNTGNNGDNTNTVTTGNVTNSTNADDDQANTNGKVVNVSEEVASNEQPLKLTASKSTKHQDSTNLPQTDEQAATTPAALGLMLLGLSGLMSFIGIKRHRTDK